MLLVADFGNTDTVLGLFEKSDVPPRVRRAESNPRRTADEWAPACRCIDHTDTDLTLDGLRLAWKRVAKSRRAARR